MKVMINGKITQFERGSNIKQLLDEDYVETQEYVTVQVNEQIIAKDEYSHVVIREGDVIEFLYYMGGGR